MSTGSTKAILAALGANVAIAISKGVAAAFTGSSAMLAETIHSTADCANQLLLLVGMKQAKRPADVHHPMGYGKVGYFWSMIVAVLLFGVGGLVSLIHGIEGLHDPQPVKHLAISLAVLAVASIAEGLSLWGALRVARTESGGMPFWQWFRTTRQSELLVVTGEDIAAEAGLLLAFLALLTTALTGNPIWDSIGSIAVGLLLMIVAIFIMREIKAMVTGESADPETRLQIESFINAHPAVDKTMNVITLHFGTNIMVAVQAQMHRVGSDIALVDKINEVERGIYDKFPGVRWVFFEPDFVDNEPKPSSAT